MTTTPTVTRRSFQLSALCVLATLVCAGLDLWSKDWALQHLAIERLGHQPPLCAPDSDGHIYMQHLRAPSIVWIEDYLELRYAENCGAAFSLFHDAHPLVRQLVFGFAAVAASAMLFWMFLRGRGRLPFMLSVPLVVGGAIGNMTDRLRHGYVIDFVRFHLRNGWEWPTFNVADVWISIGVGLLIIDGILEGRREAAAAQARKNTAAAS